MKRKNLFISLVIIGTLLTASMAFANPSASIMFQETDLGGGLWKYDYTFENTSTYEYLYSIRLYFDSAYAVSSQILPAGWSGSWGSISPTSLLKTYTNNISNDIAPGGSLDGFSFTINSQIGDVPFTAYFDNHSGGRFSLAGNTALEAPPVAPEPLSAILFVVGAMTLGTRVYLKRKKVRIHS